MGKGEKLWKKIRKAENQLLVSTPERSAKLTKKIVEWKGHVFDEDRQ
ncbi:MAG: hypothetical protein J6A46_02915 [Clostridia bacterium]|nr:hypothetical protein [Clostridia bacterium]